MDSIMNILNTLFGNSQFFTDYISSYTSYLVVAAMIFSLLNCFFGYRLRKFWSCIFGLLLGIGTGISLAVHFNLNPAAGLVSALAGGLIFTVLSFLLYRIGIFFLCIGIVIFTLFQFFPMPTFSAICGFVVFGIAIGFLAIVKEHVVVSIITAVYGAVGSAKSILEISGFNSFPLTIFLSIVLAVLGLTFQLKPWKRKRKSRKKKQKIKKQAPRPEPSHQPKTHARPSQSSGSVTDKTKVIGDTKPYYPSDNSRYRSNIAENNTDESDPKDKSELSASDYTVDLSDVRSEISREIQDIYNEESKD